MIIGEGLRVLRESEALEPVRDAHPSDTRTVENTAAILHLPLGHICERRVHTTRTVVTTCAPRGQAYCSKSRDTVAVLDAGRKR